MSSDDSNNGINPNYFYNPNVAAAILFAVLFGLPILAHIGLAIQFRTRYMVVLLFAIGMEEVGYVTRVISSKPPDPEWAAIISQVCLVVAPAFLAAQSYMVVGRMMSYIGNEYSFISHSKITKIFVLADVLAILTQAMGASMLGNGDVSLNQLNTAKKVLLGGLAVQVVTFGIFLFVAVFFHYRSVKAPELKTYEYEMRRMKKLWIAFYISGVLITLRSIYRTIEFGSATFSTNGDAAGYVLQHEWPMYVLDAVPILISVWCFAIFHPGRYLPAKKGLRIDGTYEPVKGRRRFCCCGPRKLPRREPKNTIPMGAVSESNVEIV